MRSSLVFCCISFSLLILVSATDTGLDGLWNDESLFSDPQPSFSNDDFLPSNNIASLSFTTGFDGLNPDSSEQLFANKDANDDYSILSSPFYNDDLLLADDSSQQAPDCMTPLDSLPAFERSRARRRRRDSALCPNLPNSNAIIKKWPKLPGLDELETKEQAQILKTEALSDPNYHGLCMLYSLGLLPFGVCSSSMNPADVTSSAQRLMLIGFYGQFVCVDVSHGTLGTFRETPPPFSSFFCKKITQTRERMLMNEPPRSV